MKVAFDPQAWEEYLWWQRDDAKTLLRLNTLIEECRRHPFTGTGKPEPLMGDMSGWWSRRITGAHRLVYRVQGSADVQVVEVLACRYHY